jgi:hypothetical protein
VNQVFQNEPIALSLRKLRCVRIDISSVTDPELKAEYGKTPSLRLIDPKGVCLGKVDGKGQIIALPKVSGLIKKGWSKMFTMSQGSFVRKMTKILDGYDRINAKRTQTSRNDGRKLDKLASDEDKLRKQEDEVLTACALKKTYLPKD